MLETWNEKCVTNFSFQASNTHWVTQPAENLKVIIWKMALPRNNINFIIDGADVHYFSAYPRNIEHNIEPHSINSNRQWHRSDAENAARSSLAANWCQTLIDLITAGVQLLVSIPRGKPGKTLESALLFFAFILSFLHFDVSYVVRADCIVMPKTSANFTKQLPATPARSLGCQELKCYQ